jgi:hypothetical protein
MSQKIELSILKQLQQISKQFENLEFYEHDVAGDDITDALFYVKMQNLINDHIKEIESRVTTNHIHSFVYQQGTFFKFHCRVCGKTRDEVNS